MAAKPAKSASEPSSPARGSKRFKGVRMRSWGKWVSEIRLPNTRARLWLGSYATAEQAARAYDVAVACLRGISASLNFPDSPPVYATGGLPHHQIQELAAAAAAAAAPAPPSLSSAEEEACDSGSQMDSLLTSPARSTLADESDAATPQIDARSQCSSPVSTPPDDCAFGNLLSQEFSSPAEFLNSEWDMMLADEIHSGVFGFSHWEQHISGVTVCDSIIMPLLDDDYPAFAEPCLWSL